MIKSNEKRLVDFGQSVWGEFSNPLSAITSRINSMRILLAEEKQIPIFERNFKSSGPIGQKPLNSFLEAHEFHLIYEFMSRTSENKLWSNNQHSVLELKPSYGGVTYELNTVSNEEIEDFRKLSKHRLTSKSNDVHMVAQTTRGWSITRIGEGGVPFISDNYMPEIRESFDRIGKVFSEKNPAGRLVILHGPPGSGKTFFIRGLMEKMENVKCLLVPARLAVQMEDPTFISTLIEELELDSDDTENKIPLLLIVEDADQILTTREAGDTGAISSLLNLADGIFGSLLDVRILATTNAPILEIDDALLRPGRLLEQVSISELNAMQANVVYTRLTNQDGPYTMDDKILLSEVYAEACNFKNKRRKKQKRTVGFQV